MSINQAELHSNAAKHIESHSEIFDLANVLHELKHFLPAQAPLKDFIHHNTLHAFQEMKFFDALRNASVKFGYNISLSLSEYKAAYASGRITEKNLERAIESRIGSGNIANWKKRLLIENFENKNLPRIGAVRSLWKKEYKIDIDSLVHPNLFRIICSFLDQGISIWSFPSGDKNFLNAIRELETQSHVSLFKSKRASRLIKQGHIEVYQLLEILVGDPKYFKQYLFDQQFAHQGWSGMVSTIESQPETLIDRKKFTLQDLIIFELLMEIDAMDDQFGEKWPPLSSRISSQPVNLFDYAPESDYYTALSIWQEAFEWSYHDEVLSGIKAGRKPTPEKSTRSFQAMFCIDDRECSLRRYLEKADLNCETFSTPGFFGVEFYFQPQNGKHITKLCPAPVTPKFLVKELGNNNKLKKDLHFTKHSHSFHGGWLITQTLGYWSAFKLLLNIFRPTMSATTASSFQHMDRNSKLTVETHHPEHQEKNLQVGFTVEEMANRVETLLRSIGLIANFAPIVYVVGHGSSSVNNPHYAAYDCGACSGRAGSVNARVFCQMANNLSVRKILSTREINIPSETQFLGGLHDTTRDEIEFFDEDALMESNASGHKENEQAFFNALDENAKERSRRFESIPTRGNAKSVHDKVKLRSVSLFEPRPELNHATNALCIVGRRNLTSNIFLDRRSFLNSFDYKVDPEGKYLTNILNAAAPVCGGINLEYFFSRVDNQKLGAGTKLPHNVMGLFGVANGIDGDLRTGLPSQMIEVHDPVRLMIIVEHFNEVVMQTIKKNPATYEWFINEWVKLVTVNPETGELSFFKSGEFVPYEPIASVKRTDNIVEVIERETENIPVYILN
jgi:uncharacterized protein